MAAATSTGGEIVSDAGEDRARRLFLAYRRNELLGPVRTIIESSQLLLDEPKVAACTPFAADLRTVNGSAIQVATMVERVLDPARAGVDDEARAAALKHDLHDLRNLLASVIGYGEELVEEAPRLFLDGFAAELDQIYRLGQRSLALIDEIGAHLRGEDLAAADGTFGDLYDELVPSAETTSTAPGRILVVDDNPESRESLVRRLDKQGHKVGTASDGVEALERIDAEAFDLVLLDIVMPRSNGFQVLSRLKSDPRHRDLPVIMISGLDELDAIVRCIEMGAEDYLPKPCNRVLLRARVDACLEKKRLRDAAERERRRYDQLLHDILPAEIVRTLKESSEVKPTRHDDVAVLFADIVGFTPYCDHRAPEAVVGHLQGLFVCWEEIAADCQVQKIKTIGDAFMAASGLLRPTDNAVLDCVRCGLRMIEATRALPIGWDLRVGVHVGPVVAGVLGRRQYLYDLWGDTVNTAARLESHGARGCVNLLVPAWDRVSGHFRCEDRSRCMIKGKGDEEIEVIHLGPRAIEVPAGP